ncbi:MAG: Flp family type IVb pilin [Pirellulaceae bacterium]
MISSFKTKIIRFLRNEDGPTAVEYAIMLAAVFLVAVASIGNMGTSLNAKFQDIEAQMPK